MKILFFGAVAAVCLSSAALAQEGEWSGPYVGVQAGALNQPGDKDERLIFDRDLNGRFEDDVMAGANNAFSPGFCGGDASRNTNIGCRPDHESAEVGLRGGYDWQRGNAVFGVVGEVGLVDVSDSVSGFSTTPASYTFTRDANWLAAIRGRVGYGVGPYLVYGTGGYASAEVDHRFTTSNVTNSFTERGSDTLSGYQLGVGAERYLTDNWSLGLEYLFTSLKDEDYTVRAGAGTAGPTNPFIAAPDTTGTDIRRSHSRFAFNSIRVSASYRFGR
jgi:outer membrane immunogenic protein